MIETGSAAETICETIEKSEDAGFIELDELDNEW
jgi:hypothetical protein